MCYVNLPKNNEICRRHKNLINAHWTRIDKYFKIFNEKKITSCARPHKRYLFCGRVQKSTTSQVPLGETSSGQNRLCANHEPPSLAIKDWCCWPLASGGWTLAEFVLPEDMTGPYVCACRLWSLRSVCSRFYSSCWYGEGLQNGNNRFIHKAITNKIFQTKYCNNIYQLVQNGTDSLSHDSLGRLCWGSWEWLSQNRSLQNLAESLLWGP